MTPKALGEAAPDFVLDFVGLVFEIVDASAAGRNFPEISGLHGVQEGEHFACAIDGRLHVALHRPHRRVTEQVGDDTHGVAS